MIFDEFHERSIQCDLGFAMALDVRRALRPDLRLLVMSATLDTSTIAAHPRLANMMIMSGAADIAAIIEEGAPHGITDVHDVRLTSRMKELARRWRRMVLPFCRERVAGACFCQADGGTGTFGGSPV